MQRITGESDSGVEQEGAVMKVKDRVLSFFKQRKRQKAYMIKRLPICMELSDGDRAALYGWPDYRVEEVENEKRK